jgi:hypothetical protein
MQDCEVWSTKVISGLTLELRAESMDSGAARVRGLIEGRFI